MVIQLKIPNLYLWCQMTRPISPAELAKLKQEQVPELVYEAINNLLLDAKLIRGKLVVPLELLKEKISFLYDNKSDMEIVIHNALAQYSTAGWSVRRSVFDWDDPAPEVIYFNQEEG